VDRTFIKISEVPQTARELDKFSQQLRKNFPFISIMTTKTNSW